MKDLRAKNCDFFKCKLKLPGSEWMLYELSGGDLTKTVILRKQPLTRLYIYCYLKRINDLNMLLISISQLEEIKGE